MTPESPQLSIITVTYNHRSEIIPFLNAILNSDGIWNAEIIIIDNASTDDTPRVIQAYINAPIPRSERFQIRLIQSPVNSGFTAGTNLGLRNARGNFILLLNPDAQVTPSTLSKMQQYLLKNPKVGMLAPQLLNPDHSIQPSCRHFPRRQDVIWHLLGWHRLFPHSPIFNHWKIENFDHQKPAEVDQPQGAALMTTRQAFRDIGLLDENFPMFFSDVDWCRRFNISGWKIVCLPEAQIIHQKGTSIHRHRIRMIWSSHLSFTRYFRKYYHGFFNSILNRAIGILLMILAMLRISSVWLKRKLNL